MATATVESTRIESCLSTECFLLWRALSRGVAPPERDHGQCVVARMRQSVQDMSCCTRWGDGLLSWDDCSQSATKPWSGAVTCALGRCFGRRCQGSSMVRPTPAWSNRSLKRSIKTLKPSSLVQCRGATRLIFRVSSRIDATLSISSGGLRTK
jgi:hypothetical protein